MKWKGNARYNQELDTSTTYMSECCGIVVHRIIHFDGWFLSCNELGISQMELKSEDFNDVAKEAREIIKNRLISLQGKYDLFLSDCVDEQVRYF